jgi:hypothetical protein
MKMDFNEKIKIKALGGFNIRAMREAFDKIEVQPFKDDEILAAYSECSGWNYLHDRRLNTKIDQLVSCSCFSFEKCVFATIAWCMTRPGSWFSIEPILDVTQFKSSPLNQWSRFCTYDMPFRFTYNGVQFNVEAQTRKRKGTNKESNATKKLKLN